MNPAWWKHVEPVAHREVELFTDKLKRKLSDPAEKIVLRKNPFLFRVRVASDANEFARMVTDAYLSSSEETMFGNVLEKIAVSICEYAKGGKKSAARNIDLEYGDSIVRTIVQIKSGENWGNSSQRKALVSSFDTATRILRQGDPDLHVRRIEGICYGRSKVRKLNTHDQYVGHEFWKEISDWDGTALAVFDLIGEHARNGLDEARREAYARVVSYLNEHGAAGLAVLAQATPEDSPEVTSSMNWDGLLELVMNDKA